MSLPLLATPYLASRAKANYANYHAAAMLAFMAAWKLAFVRIGAD